MSEGPVKVANLLYACEEIVAWLGAIRQAVGAPEGAPLVDIQGACPGFGKDGPPVPPPPPTRSCVRPGPDPKIVSQALEEVEEYLKGCCEAITWLDQELEIDPPSATS